MMNILTEAEFSAAMNEAQSLTMAWDDRGIDHANIARIYLQIGIGIAMGLEIPLKVIIKEVTETYKKIAEIDAPELKATIKP